MEKTAIIYTLLTACLPVAVIASEKDSAMTEHMSMWNTTREMQIHNPAIRKAAFKHSYSEIFLSEDYRHQSRAFVLQKGTGFSLPGVKVDTYLTLSEKSSVWGSASYITGKQYDITWNSTSDYDMLAPYILADTIGGDTEREKYSFSGGYATEMGRWTLGGELTFRAEHEYRDIDPRMRAVVTEMTIKAGAATTWLGYTWNACVEGNIYNQTNDVDFYNELGVIPELQMTGLGDVYNRFSDDKRDIYYKGGGIDLHAGTTHEGENGPYAQIMLGKRKYKRSLADLNSLPLTNLIYDNMKGQAGWKKKDGKRKTAIQGCLSLSEVSGDEYIAGTSSTRYFPTIGKLTMYKRHLLDACISGLYGRKHRRTDWTATAKAGYRSIKERNIFPERKMENKNIYGCIDGQFFVKASDKMMITLTLGGSHSANIDSRIVMPYANMDNKTVEMIHNTFRFRKANYTDIHAGARADYATAISKIGLFAEIKGGETFCSEEERQTDFHFAFGLTF